ncbi:MAG: hypothetical protein U0836_19555 [Pirellulales bacterium]
MTTRPICGGILLALALCVGCGESLPTVSGKVTIDGKPVPEGMISFQPQPSGAIAVAPIRPDGSYEVKTGTATGLKPGEYIIVVQAPKGIPPAPTAQNPNPKFERWVPAKYGNPETSGLQLTVTSGSITHNLDLKSK